MLWICCLTLLKSSGGLSLNNRFYICVTSHSCSDSSYIESSKTLEFKLLLRNLLMSPRFVPDPIWLLNVPSTCSFDLSTSSSVNSFESPKSQFFLFSSLEILFKAISTSLNLISSLILSAILLIFFCGLPFSVSSSLNLSENTFQKAVDFYS